MSVEDFKHLGTELQNPRSGNIDLMSTEDLLTLINDEDATVIESVKRVVPVIQQVVDHLEPLIKKGGRLFYLGAGTSGRLGVLDASEIPPTYSMPHGKFVGLIAGGDMALRQAKEFSEDDLKAAMLDLQPYNLNPELDTILGIASSGRTPYVIGALKYAREIGCPTVGLACVQNPVLEPYSDYMISCITGPEVVTGSTRMKAGTATKLILNMISTATMVNVGKTYGNLMVDLMPTNLKLRDRTRRILRAVCGNKFYVIKGGRISASAEYINDDSEGDKTIDNTLNYCEGSLKMTIIVAKTGILVSEAKRILNENGGILRRALLSLNELTDDLLLEDSGVYNTLPTPSLSSSSIAMSSLENWNLVIDINNNRIEICFYKQNETKFNSCYCKDLNEDLINIVELTCKYIDPLFDKSKELGVESIKIGVDKYSDYDLVANAFKEFHVHNAKVQVVFGSPRYCELIKSVLSS